MNTRWAARILGIIMILVFLGVLMMMEKQLAAIAKARGVNTTTSAKP